MNLKLNTYVSFGHQDSPSSPFEGEDVQQHGLNDNPRDGPINEDEKLNEKDPDHAKDLKSQSSELKDSLDNNQKKTKKTNKCNWRHHRAAAEPCLPKERIELRKNGDSFKMPSNVEDRSEAPLTYGVNVDTEKVVRFLQDHNINIEDDFLGFTLRSL
ncbi:hypothetical protein FGADI_12857 [Fusarium gaditjirri]|uniref:Uncharacterized protein n=1 Tax=Fusarium gaditjirri TaxID=282569 RepID=A0A8H4SR57_9HYPO|nr:hypothetical protein FGADI_12857 [Fusarium gaditjirri]